MKKLTRITTFSALFALLAAPAFSDTLVLKSGEKVSGLFEGGPARVIRFRTSDGVLKDYDLLTIQQIQFGSEEKAAAPARLGASADSRLLPSTVRVTRGRHRRMPQTQRGRYRQDRKLAFA